MRPEGMSSSNRHRLQQKYTLYYVNNFVSPGSDIYLALGLLACPSSKYGSNGLVLSCCTFIVCVCVCVCPFVRTCLLVYSLCDVVQIYCALVNFVFYVWKVMEWLICTCMYTPDACLPVCTHPSVCGGPVYPKFSAY